MAILKVRSNSNDKNGGFQSCEVEGVTSFWRWKYYRDRVSDRETKVRCPRSCPHTTSSVRVCMSEEPAEPQSPMAMKIGSVISRLLFGKKGAWGDRVREQQPK